MPPSGGRPTDCPPTGLRPNRTRPPHGSERLPAPGRDAGTTVTCRAVTEAAPATAQGPADGTAAGPSAPLCRRHACSAPAEADGPAPCARVQRLGFHKPDEGRRAGDVVTNPLTHAYLGSQGLVDNV